MRRWRSSRCPSARSGVNLTLTTLTLAPTPTPTPTLFLTLALALTPTLALALPLAQVKSRLDAVRAQRFRGHALAAVASPFKRIGTRLRRSSSKEGGNQRTTGRKGSAPSWSSSAGYPPAARHSSPDLRRPSAGYPPSASPSTGASSALRRASTSNPRGAAAEGKEGGEAPHTPGPPPAEGKELELMELALAYELMSRVAMQEG